MPASLLGTTSKIIAQSYPAIVGGVRQGLSANAIIAMLRQKLGVAGRRSTLLDVIRREREAFTYGQRLKYLALTRTPDLERLPEALTRLRRRYSFTVEVKGFLSASGAPWSQFVTVSSSKGLTRGEIETRAAEAVQAGADRYGLAVESTMLVGGLRAGDFGTFS